MVPMDHVLIPVNLDIRGDDAKKLAMMVGMVVIVKKDVVTVRETKPAITRPDPVLVFVNLVFMVRNVKMMSSPNSFLTKDKCLIL